MSYCNKCGTKLTPKANYCDSCGTPAPKKVLVRVHAKPKGPPSVKIGKGLRITIPKSIAKALNLEAGDMISFSIEGSRIIVEKGGS